MTNKQEKMQKVAAEDLRNIVSMLNNHIKEAERLGLTVTIYTIFEDKMINKTIAVVVKKEIVL